jgi:LAGLIDADG endonuclease
MCIWLYAGKPEYPALPRGVRSDVYHGDNVTGAENQQERLIEFRGWVIGFVDGEGCFSIGLVRQPNRTGRRGYVTGYQVSHDFVVTQNASSVESLHELKEFFGVGQVYVNRRSDNHREHMHRYCVCRRSDLLEAVIPFFRQHPLRTAKRYDFEKFAYCVELMADGRHLTHAGLAEIVEVMQTMNRKKPRHELIRILRGHTPEALDIGS